MTTLKTFWSTFKVKLQWLIDSADLLDKPDHENRLKIRLLTVSTEFTALENAYQRIIEFADLSVKAEEEILVAARREYGRALEAYDKLMIKQLEAGTSSSVSSETKSETTKVDSDALISRLPVLRLPTFSGEMDQWVGFNNLFDSLVDSRSDLSPAQKLAYLMSCLNGEARGLVQHIKISDEGYQTARDLLLKRYQNTRHLADVHVEQILKLPNITHRLNGLRSHFLNPLIMAINSLERLGLPVSEWSFLLLHIVLTKLPTTLKTRFEQKCGCETDSIPTFTELIEFLETECRLLECTKSDPAGPQTESVPSSSRPQRRTGQYLVAAVAQGCFCCGDGNHGLNKCPKFRSLTPFERKEFTQRNRLCYYCFGSHNFRSCRNPPQCDGCGSRNHHPLLCFNKSGVVHTQRVNNTGQRLSPPRTGGGDGNFQRQINYNSGFRRVSPRGSPRASPPRVQCRDPSPGHTRMRRESDDRRDVTRFNDNTRPVYGRQDARFDNRRRDDRREEQ